MPVILFVRCMVSLCVILLGTIGVALFGLGIYLLLNIDSILMAYVGSHLHAHAANSLTIGLEFFTLPFPPVFYQLVYALMLFGTITIMLSIFGYCVAHQSGTMVTMYSGALCSILALQMIGGAYVQTKRGTLHMRAKSALQTTIARNYTGNSILAADISSAGLITNLWDSVMVSMQCCGVDSFRDFAHSEQWLRNGNSTIPLACCALKDISDPRAGFRTKTCPAFPTYEDSHKERGCFKYIWQVAEPVLDYSLLLMATICALEFLTALLCCCIYSLVLEQRNRDEDLSTGCLCHRRSRQGSQLL